MPRLLRPLNSKAIPLCDLFGRAYVDAALPTGVADVRAVAGVNALAPLKESTKMMANGSMVQRLVTMVSLPQPSTTSSVEGLPARLTSTSPHLLSVLSGNLAPGARAGG